MNGRKGNHNEVNQDGGIKSKYFSSIVSGVRGKVNQKRKNVLRTLKTDEDDLLVVFDVACLLLEKVRDMRVIANLELLLLKEGFYVFELDYISGLWM